MLFYLKGNNSKIGDNSDKKKYGSPIFSYMKFQNISIMVLKLCYAPESVTNKRNK